MRRIQLSDMAPHVHTFRSGENKVDKLSKWLISWIVISMQNGKVRPFDMLPSKAELACHIGVSLGTMQNVFRFVEDAGYIESKQKIGSYIKDRKIAGIEKLTSKKDLATDVIKKFLRENDYKAGDVLISTRKLAKLTGVSNTTIRVAITQLILQGILEKKKNSFIVTGRSYRINDVESKTLVEKIASNIKKYIKKELKAGDKLPPNSILAGMFKVSTKTIHDSIKQLAKEGVVYARRGQYGTIVLGKSENKTELYNYEKFEQKIRHYIASDFKIGDKLPSIKSFSEMYKTSEKTIKKALDNLAEEGYLTFVRGRYGGTFVTDIPSQNEGYTWLAISPDYVQNSEN